MHHTAASLLKHMGHLTGRLDLLRSVALVLPAGILTWPCETPTKSLPAWAVPSTVE